MTEFEMTQEQSDEILEACKPTLVMYFPKGELLFKTAEENTNTAWKKLGRELGFDHMTVKPNGKGDKFFTAKVVK